MKNKKISYLIPIFFLLFILIFTGCAKKQLSTEADCSFENYTTKLFSQDVTSDTLTLHYTLENPENYQIKEPEVTLGRLYADNSAAIAALENSIAALEQFPYRSLSRNNQITYDVLYDYLTQQKELAPFSMYDEPLGKTSGIQAQLPILLSEYPLRSERDVQTYLALLSDIPGYFESIVEFEQTKAKTGLFMSDTNAEHIIEQCEAFLSMGDDNYLITTFKERLDNLSHISKKARNTYLRKNQNLLVTAIYPAYKNLIQSLNELKGSGKNEYGLCFLPNGQQYYSLLLERQTGSSRSVTELEHLVYSQIADDVLAMQQIVAKNPNLAEQDNARIDTNPEHILKTLSSGICKNFPAPPSVQTEVKYVPEAMQEFLSPAFYLVPPIDSTSNNVIYINPKHQTSDIYLFTTLAHEGYPGHLYQTTYFASTNPNPIRSLLSFGGYTEGWATYAEMCSYSLSPLNSTVASLLQKNSSLLLGVYSACDIGIHYHGWDYKKASEFLSKYKIEDAELVREIYDLIIDDPGNYLKYYIGYVEFLELKKEAIQIYQDDFSQTEFHKKILEIGPAPFSVVRKYLFS